MAAVLALLYFIVLMILVQWNLRELSHHSPLSQAAVGLVFVFVFMVILLTILILAAVAIILALRVRD